MPHNLIQIGNSKALIIPAKIVKKRNYDQHTEFDIIETNDGFRIVHKLPSTDALEFPKVARPTVSARLKGIISAAKLSLEDIDSDDKLKYLLSR